MDVPYSMPTNCPAFQPDSGYNSKARLSPAWRPAENPGSDPLRPAYRMTQPRRDHADRSPIVERKTRRFFSVPLDATVLQTLQVMAEHNVGAVCW